MSADFVFSGQCPKCGNRAFERPASIDLDGEFTCPACDHVASLAEFADAATRDRILGLANKAVSEALKNIPGL